MNEQNTADPVTLAREVVDDYERLDDWNKPRTRSGKEVPPSRVTLARTVLRMEALADRLSAEAADDFDGVSGTSVSLVKYETAKAIRAALNGETA